MLNRLAYLCSEVHNKRGQLHWTDSLQWSVREGVLIFSGSDSIRDWYHDLKLWSVPSETGLGFIHAGFMELAVGTFPQIKETVLGKEHIHTVTGYSLGGSVALLVAEVLKDVQVVTFGCPVTGTHDWARRYPHPVTRCRVAPDLIATPILGRVHVGEEVTLCGSWNPLYNHLHTLERNWNDVRKV